MEPSHETLNIYQLRIVLRGISPLIWRRVLVRDDTTLAQLHDLIQILLQWRHEQQLPENLSRKDFVPIMRVNTVV